MRKILSEILSDSNGMIEVMDSAQDGLDAIDKNKKLKPDVITLDVEMPRMDGLSALEEIMKENPTPVIMLSSHTGKGTETTIKALELGAVDCVVKPVGKVLENIRNVQSELIEKIKMAALCKVNYRKLTTTVSATFRSSAVKKNLRKTGLPAGDEKPATFIVAIASSTGGPGALNELFSKLKSNSNVCFIIVQHISAGFTKALAKRLEEVSELKMSEAEEGEALLAGHAYIAPGGTHLTVKGTPGFFRFAFNDQPPRLGVKPSADIMMFSVAKSCAEGCVGVVLTGMGRDGTVGLKEIRAAGGVTFAQDAESCVVYGMPKSAVEAGVVDHQMRLETMAEAVNQLLIRQKGP